MDDYDLSYELQRSQFFKDCLNPEIDFQLKNGSVSVYKQLDSGISEEISVDELIYFIQYDVAENIEEEYERGSRLFKNPTPSPGNPVTNLRLAQWNARVDRVKTHHKILDKFKKLYCSIICIRNDVQNMKIILKYGKLEESEEEEEDKEEKEEPLMTEVSTVKIG
jgi:uncharacterized protein (UPF0335 family)